MIAHEEEEGPGVGLDGVTEEGADSLVELFADHCVFNLLALVVASSRCYDMMLCSLTLNISDE